MSRAAGLLVLAYGLMLLLVGAAGILAAEWELRQLYGMGSGGTARPDATFLNQYRFLKAVEMGAGAFCIALRGPIMEGRAAMLPFVLLVGGGIFARGFAWAVDGRPSWPFLLFLALELLVLIVFLVHRSRSDAA